jgi:hypothetical protein
MQHEENDKFGTGSAMNKFAYSKEQLDSLQQILHFPSQIPIFILDEKISIKGIY